MRKIKSWIRMKWQMRRMRKTNELEFEMINDRINKLDSDINYLRMMMELKEII